MTEVLHGYARLLTEYTGYVHQTTGLATTDLQVAAVAFAMDPMATSTKTDDPEFYELRFSDGSSVTLAYDWVPV